MICFYRSIRVAAAEQFLIMSSLGTTHQFLQLCIVLLFSVLHTHVIEYASNSHEYFQVIIFNLIKIYAITTCQYSLFSTNLPTVDVIHKLHAINISTISVIKGFPQN